MKSIYLFTTKVRMYWVLLPMALLLTLAIIYNPYAPRWYKLYPLMALSVAGMIFVFIFYFRLIRLNFTEIKDIGRFSPRDSALINEGKVLVLRDVGHGKLRVYLYGADGLPELDWMRDQTTDPSVICMYRGRAVGGRRTVARVLRYFGVYASDIDGILHTDGFRAEYDCVRVSTRIGDGERKEYVIEMTKTV